MNNEKIGAIIGGILLVIGIIILLITLVKAIELAQGSGDYFREQFPELVEEEEAEGPNAMFSWSSNDLTVQFMDESEMGDAAISNWEWNFGDGETSQYQSPSHTYDSRGDYRVRLRVEDGNGLSSTIYGDVNVENNNQGGGTSEPDYGDFSFEGGNFFLPMAAALLVGLLFIVMFLVGGALIKAGWNLIKPGPSTLKMKIKPKHVEAEWAGQTTAPYTQKAPSATPVFAQSTQMNYPSPATATIPGSTQSMPMNAPQTNNVQSMEQAQAVVSDLQSVGLVAEGSPQGLEPMKKPPERPIFPSPREENGSSYSIPIADSKSSESTDSNLESKEEKFIKEQIKEEKPKKEETKDKKPQGKQRQGSPGKGKSQRRGKGKGRGRRRSKKR